MKMSELQAGQLVRGGYISVTLQREGDAEDGVAGFPWLRLPLKAEQYLC